jgi:hypothetical protein
MKYIYLFLVLAFLGSCKKTTDNDFSSQNESANSAKIKIEENVVEPPCISPLTHSGNGVYITNYKGITVTVTNISYPLYDIHGNPLPPRNGDPAYGYIQVNAQAGEQVTKHPEIPNNHFVITQVTWGPTIATINWSSYNSALSSYNQELSNYITLTTDSIPGNNPSTFPTSPIITQFTSYVPTGGGTGTNIITGKLVRISSGSTFALVCEDYPELPPPPPIIVSD